MVYLCDMHALHNSQQSLFIPLQLCAGKNLEPQPQSACAPRVPGSRSQRPESSQGERCHDTGPTSVARFETVASSRNVAAVVATYLHNDLICFAMSHSIWFDDGNCAGFTVRDYSRREQLEQSGVNADKMVNRIAETLINSAGYCRSNINSHSAKVGTGIWQNIRIIVILFHQYQLCPLHLLPASPPPLLSHHPVDRNL